MRLAIKAVGLDGIAIFQDRFLELSLLHEAVTVSQERPFGLLVVRTGRHCDGDQGSNDAAVADSVHTSRAEGRQECRNRVANPADRRTRPRPVKPAEIIRKLFSELGVVLKILGNYGLL